jgi:hypothetical protein
MDRTGDHYAECDKSSLKSQKLSELMFSSNLESRPKMIMIIIIMGWGTVWGRDQ